MMKNTTRRNFLRSAPIAAAATVALADKAVHAQTAPAAVPSPANAAPFKLFTAKELKADEAALLAAPGNKNLIDQNAGFPSAIVLTSESKKSAKEFEWHEGRDHIVLITEGATKYEVGGKPINARNIRPGEWLAPDSEGNTTMMLGPGDMLVIPRGTPHKRSTEDTVTLLLISPFGNLSS